MIRRRLLLVATVHLLMLTNMHAQSIVLAEWKFLNKDNPEYIDSALNEYWWPDISPLTVWEQQGYEGFDGYGWYRVKVVIPSSMKKNAYRYGGLMLRLGKIHDADVTYFNGHIVGSTGLLPPDYEPASDVQRSYLVSPEYISWDKKNTIAVRVYNPEGDGGLLGGPVELTNRSNDDLLTLATAFNEDEMIFEGSPDVEIPVTLKSDFRKKFRGTIKLSIITESGEEFTNVYRDVAVKKNSTARISLVVKDLKPGFYNATISLESKMGNKRYSFDFGYEPEEIVSSPEP